MPDSPGWRVRAFQNLYPAFVESAPTPRVESPFEAIPARGRQEVVVHVPRHALSLADLTPLELASVATAWRARARAAQETGFAYAHVFVNEGRAAGASRAHTHSQLVALPDVPPAVVAERVGNKNGRCGLCSSLAAERRESVRFVLEPSGLATFCPFASITPYELLVAPFDCDSDAFASPLLTPAIEALATTIRRLRSVLPGAPLNIWLHTAPLQGGEAHWHFHVFPRLATMAGIELGAGVFVNAMPPEDAAAILREAAAG